MVTRSNRVGQPVQARDEAKEALSSQEASQFKLQVELAEAQKAAAGITDLEKELARYRRAARVHQWVGS